MASCSRVRRRTCWSQDRVSDSAPVDVDRPSRDPGQEREDRVTHGVMDTLVAVTRVDKEITDKKQRNVELPFQIEDAAISDALDVLSYSILLPAIY